MTCLSPQNILIEALIWEYTNVQLETSPKRRIFVSLSLLEIKNIYIREKRTVSVFWVFILVQLENVPKPPKSKSFWSLDFQISCAQLYVWTNISKPEKPVTMELWVQRYQIGIFNIHIIFRRKVLNCFITGPPLDLSQSFSAVLTPEPLTPVSNPRLTSRLHSQYPTGLSFFQSHE